MGKKNRYFQKHINKANGASPPLDPAQIVKNILPDRNSLPNDLRDFFDFAAKLPQTPSNNTHPQTNNDDPKAKNPTPHINPPADYLPNLKTLFTDKTSLRLPPRKALATLMYELSKAHLIYCVSLLDSIVRSARGEAGYTVKVTASLIKSLREFLGQALYHKDTKRREGED
ncbi:MAG: hypothetical protein Kow0090_13480 [Myxococcota bacterium]